MKYNVCSLNGKEFSNALLILTWSKMEEKYLLTVFNLTVDLG